MLHTINPVFLTIGPLHLRYYSLMYLLALVIGYIFLTYFAKNSKSFPLKQVEILDFLFWIFLGVIIGGRLGNVLFYNPLFYASHPLEIFAIWNGGMSFHGGLLGVIIVSLLYCKKKKIHILLLADYLVIPAALGLMFGRIGNLLNGELWGRITTLPFCLDYSQNPFIQNPPKGCRHPYQLYAIMKNLLIFTVLFGVFTLRKFRQPGTIFFLFIIMYGTLRSILEFFREPSWVYWGITAGQWLSLPLILGGIVGMMYIYRNGNHLTETKPRDIK